MAGECWQAMEAWDRAATALEGAIQASGPEDRVSLPRLVWVLLQGGRRWAALRAIMGAVPIDAPGHAGLPESVRMLRTAWPDSGVDALLADSADPAVRRTLWTVSSLAAKPPIAAPDTVADTATVISAMLQSQGADSAVAWLLAWVRADRDSAERIAVAMRGTAAPMARWRELLGSGASIEADRALLLARLELAGGDPEAACRAIESVPGWRGQPALLAAAIVGAGAMEDGARLRSLLPDRTDDVPVAAAAAQALTAIADANGAARWAERAIAIDAHDPRAWVARAVADRAKSSEGEAGQDPAWRSAAAISAERAWECAPGSESAARSMLELAPADADVQSELAELTVRGQGRDASRREWDRHQALRRVQQGQGEPVVETLRALLAEDPTDVPVAAALVAAAAASGELVDTEAWLDRLRVRRPAAPAVIEALVSAKARQGRLTEGVQLLREASLADPASMARRRAWARALAVAGRHEEAWSVIAPGCQGQSGPRAALECAEQALRSGREAVAVEMLGDLVRSPDLTPAQRLALMVIANRVPRSTPSRRELLAAGGRASMDLPGASAQLLAAAMLAGTEADAALLARSGMRDWKVPSLLEGVQFLLDEVEPGRAGSLLLAGLDRADRSDRRSLERALCAVLCLQGDGEAAERRLQAWRASEGVSLLADGAEASEAQDLNELGGSLLIAGHRAQAERIFARAIEVDAGLGSALNNLAWLRIERGALDDRTDELVRRAMEAGPEDPSTLDTAAWWDYLRMPPSGAASPVIDRLRKATAGEAPSLESLDHLGDALWSEGRRDDAARAWRSIVEAASGRASRERVMQAFNVMQKRLWGVRAWDAASFYDARDGAALGRAQAKLKALAEGRQPPVTPRPAPLPADPAPSTDSAP
jgi:tetratricopeptide (TPR) repeat protein